MSYGVSVSDVAARWRPLDAQEEEVCEVLLADAEELLNSQFPALRPAVSAEKVNARLVTGQLCAMVIRVLRNPDALTGQAVEDISQNFAGPKYDGALYVSESEAATLNAALANVGGAEPRAFTVNTIERAVRRLSGAIPRRL